uniref:RNA-directed DNA polymerase n=1 Tax=Caenorhabditis japonica TaxID=281687 RepID=A0A8R1DHX7_CAEJA
MTKAHNQEALTEALAALMTPLASSNELHRQLMEENRALRDAASAAEPPRATAGGTRVPHNIGEPDSFKRWFSRHEPIFEEDGSELSEREKTRLLLGSLEETTFHRFVDSQRDVEDVYGVTFKETVAALMKIFGAQRSIMVQRQACFHISRSLGNWEDPLEYTNHIGQLVADAKLATMTADEWSVFLFFRGLDAPGDAAAKNYLMQFTEMAERKGDTITLSQIHDEWMRFLQIKQQTKIVATSKQNPQTPVEVRKLGASKPKRRESPKVRPEGGSKNRGPLFCEYCKKTGHHVSKCFLKKKEGNKKTQAIKVDVVNAELSAKRSVRVNVNGKPLQFDLDTGSMITLINSKSWKFIGRPPLERVEHRISCANGSEMREYVYVREKDTNLIGMSWLSQSPLMRKAMDSMVNQIELPSAGKAASRLETKLTEEFPTVFSERLGRCCKEKAQFRTSDNAPPIFKRARPVPYGSLEAVEKELERLQDIGVIEPVTHSKWASPIVVIKKKDTGKTRVCGDFKCSGLNKALRDEYHPLPTCEDIFGKLRGSIFSQIDLKDAYLQVEMDEESQHLAVINTHKGLFKYKRMAFGLKTAPAIFQRIVDKMISGLSGVAAYLNDVIVSADSMEEHETNLRNLFKRIEEYGFRVSPDKCTFARSEISFLGFIVDTKGRRPDPKKTSAIRTMKAPNDQKQLSSFLGAICFYSRFVSNICTLRGPLDRLMKKDVTWKWTNVEQEAFEKLKTAVADNTMLSHFRDDWPIIVAADASAYGIGGVLLHTNPDGIEVPVAHVARSLTDTEQRYSQIEKEALALVYTVKKCHKFIFGRRFHLQTDHRPLLAIFGSSKDLPVHAQNRLVRWAMTLMAYEYPRNEDDVVIAEIDAEDDEVEWSNDAITPVLESTIRAESEKDSEVSKVVDLVAKNSWKAKPSEEIEKNWYPKKDRLKIIRGCLLLDDRVVVPKSLWETVLKQLHDGHPGIIRMKQKARSFVFWRGLDAQIEQIVKFCDNCQTNSKMPRVTPLQPWPAPKKPWTRIHVDFAGPIDGILFLVVVDAKTKYAEVKLTRKISAVATVDLMEEIFSTHGYPELIVSDNGTQLTSQLFKQMCESHGIAHKTTATYYPRSNGAAERFVDTLKRGISKIKGSASINQQVLNNFIINYRNTPHAALNGATPAECHFSRKIRTTMSLLMPSERASEKTEWTDYQNKMKGAYDKRNGARANTFKVGQKVYARVQHELDVVNSGRSPRGVRQGVFGSSPAAHDTSRSDGFDRVNRGNQKRECRSELNEHQPNSRTFLERKEEVSSPCKQQLESEVQQDVSCVQPAPNLSQSLRRSQRNRRAPVRYDPCLELQSHSEDRAPKRGSAPYSDRAAARSRGLHIASNCRLAPSQGRTKDNFVKGEGVGKARGRPRWY